jgi:alkanesulfonate monooxygenase SsuD/methylene tetrahydromethanopterin reductase-like flavin-dependent oxidoreductase (luciferase family)
VRIGMSVPLLRPDRSRPLDGQELAERARMIEAAGLDGIWLGDGIPIMSRPDPLMWLLTCALATERVEIGTCIYVISNRHALESAQRFLTLEALTPGRFSIGVGSGSGRGTSEVMGFDFDTRFSRMHESMAIIKEICAGKPLEIPASPHFQRISPYADNSAPKMVPWGQTVGGPRFLLGAWHSDISLKRAVRDYDGWMCSAGRTNFNTMRDAINRYRDLGGQRAMISTCQFDLSAPSQKIADDESFYLMCGAEEAKDRLGRVAELGFDDILLVKADHQRPGGLYEPDFSLEELEEIRTLLPADERAPVGARA